MMQEVLTYGSIYLSCMFKIILGPVIGYAAGVHPLVTALFMMLGMMTTVIIFSYLGKNLREKIFKKFFKQKKLFTKRNRQFVKVWSKYGVAGISFLTPILLSPPGGSLIAIILGSPRKKLILHMFIWSTIWSVITTYIFYTSGDSVRNFFSSN